MLRVAVDIGRARVVCAVARTTTEQSRGLQGHLGLAEGTGMLFPFHPPRRATFHMGTVAFPIDLVFADASGTVQKTVLGAQPGARSTWSHPVVGAVVEVPSGYVRRAGIALGDVVRVAQRKLGAQTYNLLRTLTEANSDAALDAPRGPEGPFDVHGDPLDGGYYSKEPEHAPPDFGGGRSYLTSPQRYNERTLPDVGPDAMPQPNANWEQGVGYFRPLSDDPVYSLRPSASVRVDLTTLVPKLLVGALRVGLNYAPLELNPKSERAVITPKDIGQWIHALGLSETDREHVFNAATSNEGLNILADALLLEGFASTANIAHLGDQNILVLTRRK